MLSKPLRFVICFVAAAAVLLAQERDADSLLNQAKAAFQAGRADEAERDVDSILKVHGDDLGALMLKGAILDAEQRYAEAGAYYERALKIAPNNPGVLNNLGNHFLESGNRDEARKYYRATVAIDAHHANANLQLAGMSVDDKQGRDALMYLDRLPVASRGGTGATLLRARALALTGNFDAASSAFQTALKQRPEDAALRAAMLDFAAVCFRVKGPGSALAELDKVPDACRNADYYLLRAEMFDSMGKMQDAVDSINRAIRAAPKRSDIYQQGAAFLVKHNLLQEAFDLLNQATRVLPDDRELLFTQVVILQLQRKEADAQQLLTTIQARWRQWGRAYLLRGILLEIQLKSAEARKALETAISLGAKTPEAYYYEALAITHAAPDDLDSADNAITKAMALSSSDPYIFSLAGKISLAKKDYSRAVDRFSRAARLNPSLIPPHYGLRDAYRELGEQRMSNAESEEIKRLAKENPPDDTNPFAVEKFLFAVHPQE